MFGIRVIYISKLSREKVWGDEKEHDMFGGNLKKRTENVLKTRFTVKIPKVKILK